MHNTTSSPDLKEKTNVNVNDPNKTSGTSPPDAHISGFFAIIKVPLYL